MSTSTRLDWFPRTVRCGASLPAGFLHVTVPRLARVSSPCNRGHHDRQATPHPSCWWGRVDLYLGAALLCLALSFGVASAGAATPDDGNRLAYLDEAPMFHVGLDFPKLTVPQWLGEPGVEAVVILAIDDMRDTAKYESYLRPILNRLKQIDGRAPVSIMANAVQPDDAQLAVWLEEGLSCEVHTLAHPCPCLQKGSFQNAADTFHGCVDLLGQIPGNTPVAYRMPCCDSMNSPSPRFYREIFLGTNSQGAFLRLDSSVMNIVTSEDQSLPRAWVKDEQGRERFAKYLPPETTDSIAVGMGSFVTTVENYPYPYVMAGRVWEFPCAVPSDWEAQNLHGVNRPQTVRDWQVLLDVTVRKQGVFNLVFHPHGWIRAEQVVALIDHAVEAHGDRVRFLTFQQAQNRLQNHLLQGHALRGPDGGDHGVRLMDLNGDGFQDVVIGHKDKRLTRLWNETEQAWREYSFPALVQNCRFGVVSTGKAKGDRVVVCLESADGGGRRGWHWTDNGWVQDEGWWRGVAPWQGPQMQDRGLRLRDVDADGGCELLVSNPWEQSLYVWSEENRTWSRAPYTLPAGVTLVDERGRDNGVRFVDVNLDGYEDVLASNAEGYSLHLFVPVTNKRLMWEIGWHDEVFREARQGMEGELPMIVRAEAPRDNGVWFARETMWVQNEDTADLPDKVDRRSFKELLQLGMPAALAPEESLARMQVLPGLRVELAAAEPLVRDPVAFAWGADGRLWVVGMEDYPMGVGPEGRPGGTIRVLTDRDADGRYDDATLFLSDLWYPSGIMPWKDGVLVASAPDVFFAADNDGDGAADERRVLLTGFQRGNPQHLVNGFVYGLDGWVYGANGDSGGRVRSLMRPESDGVELRGRDFRFRPETGEFELISGQTQFGRHRDDWGHWFGNNNPTWAWHYYLPEHYLRRNPRLVVRDTRRVLARYENSGRVFPTSRTRQRFNDHHHFNHVTSANSAVPYRDRWLGAEFAQSLFISDPVHNLVHREVLRPDGGTFTSHRAPLEEEREFLSSSDPWFRPTMIQTGPDGALYVADFYRLVLEHPEWIPDFMESRLDLRAGEGMGRIYRVVPEDGGRRPVMHLAGKEPGEWVAALDHPNGWVRDTAQRLLVEHGETDVGLLLRKQAREAAHPQGRSQALWTLAAREELGWAEVRRGLRDADPRVRVQAIRLAESFPWQEDLAALVEDEDAGVRFQLALSLGAWEGAGAGQALAALAGRGGLNGDLRVALLSSAMPHYARMLEVWLSEPSQAESMADLVRELLVLAVHENRMDVVTDALEVLTRGQGPASTYAGWQFAVMGGFLEELDRKGRPASRVLSGRTDLLDGLASLESAAAARIADEQAEDRLRLAALDVLFHESTEGRSAPGVVASLLASHQSQALQLGALQALERNDGDETGALLLRTWRHGSPALRKHLMNTVLTRKRWVVMLLDRLEDGEVPLSQIDMTYRQRLLNYRDDSIRDRAEALLASGTKQREDLLRKYESVERLRGDGQRGRELFREHCAACHRFGGEGTELGPDLGAVANKSVPALLTAILDPNQAVEWRYVPYDVLTKDGRELAGLVTAETPNSITLRSAGGVEETIPRERLQSFESSRMSLMPEGLEAVLPVPAMADLVAFLRGEGEEAPGKAP